MILNLKSTATLLVATLAWCNTEAQTQTINKGWEFAREIETQTQGEKPQLEPWCEVTIPHTAHIEPLVVNDQWQGICHYRKNLEIADYSTQKIYYLEFEGAMNHTTIKINGEEASRTQGGYLPIVIDATPYLKAGKNLVEVRLDNHDNATTGPKPLKILDFNMYGGIYRNVKLITKNRAHITHPILANRTASGGVFITTPVVDVARSEVRIQTHVENRNQSSKQLSVECKIFDGERVVASSKSAAATFTPNANDEFVQTMEIDAPTLWSPSTPHLYRAEVNLYDNDQLVDSEIHTFGIRKFEMRNNQLFINGEQCYLRGVNRHQEYPYVGYALSDNAQYRDAWKIKQAGFDYVRLSHYPQSPAFMRACDELGLVVADAILGWQYYAENDDFKQHAYSSAHNLVRRDRNHPCVLAWEVSLNETQMPISFMTRLHNIVHSEYPAGDALTCGWMPQVYDIYFQARQHRIGHPDQMTFEKPYMVSEYGDWEYYSTNAGLNQHNHSAEKRLELSSRQFRSSGEKGLLQQAYNVQEAHNDNMTIPATGDSYWVMYDYNRGYHDEIEASGLMDIFRLPKFGYYFYQSQADLAPMTFIASYWDKNSATDVKVYSNCDKVKLYLNNRLVATQSPDTDANSTNLNHPPFTFKMGKFKAGALRADGYIDGKKVASSTIRTPKRATKLQCRIDQSGRAPQAGCNDVIFCYFEAVDNNNTVCHSYTEKVKITVEGDAEIIGGSDLTTEAGIATTLLRIGENSGEVTVRATSESGLKGEVTFTM